MKILADGGSTKIDWLLIYDDNNLKRFTTNGINPSLLSASDVEKALRETGCEHPELYDAEEIEFYGAGCTPAASVLMCQSMDEVFPQMKKIIVDSDIVGAATTLFPDVEGVACILGTGANSCLWDGQHIVRQTPALGYVLGDEGSGAVLGRLFINALYKGVLPSELKEEFEAEYQIDIYGVIDKVYRQPLANRWLASVSSFISKHIDNAGVEQLVTYNFDSFIERNILPYNRPDLPVSFVGSIAYYYKKQLMKSLDSHGLIIGQIVRSPLDAYI